MVIARVNAIETRDLMHFIETTLITCVPEMNGLSIKYYLIMLLIKLQSVYYKKGEK